MNIKFYSDILETAMLNPTRLIRLTSVALMLSAASLYAQEQKADESTAESAAAPVEAKSASAEEKPEAAADQKAAEDKKDALDTARMKAETAIEESKREKSASDYYLLARKEFEKCSYNKASEYALKAIEIWRDGKPASDDPLQSAEVKKGIDSAKSLLAKSYYNMALEMFINAEKSMNAYMYADAQTKTSSMYDDAIAKCLEAVAIDPDNKEIKAYSDALIKKFNRLKDACEYESETAPNTVDSQRPERQLTIEREMRKGQQFYKTGQWAKARDHFQAVLLEDPYNEMATDYLRRCFLKLIETGRRRHDIVTLERGADVAWKSVSAISSPNNVDEAEGMSNAQSKADDTKNIDGKLKSIIIPHLDFEDQTLQEVIERLRQRSKELDPDKNGVNILLFLSNKPAKKASAKAGDASGSEESSAAGADDNSGSEDTAEESSNEADGEDTAEESSDEEGGEEENEEEGADKKSAPSSTGGGRTTYMIPYLKVDNVNLRQAIELVCEAASQSNRRIHYRIEPHAVLIADDGVPLDECELKVFVVEKDVFDFLDSSGDDEDSKGGENSEESAARADRDSAQIKKFFQNQGVPFPANAAIQYDSAISRLVVSNTPSALAMINDIIEQRNTEQTSQVLVQVKFVEVQLNDLQELGFEYVISRTNTGDKSVWTEKKSMENYIAGLGPVNGTYVMNNPYGNGTPYTLVYYPATTGNGTTVLNGAQVLEGNTGYVSSQNTAVINGSDQLLLPVNGVSSYYALPLNVTSIYGSAVTWGPNSQLVRNAKDDTNAYTNTMTVNNDTVVSWSHQDKETGVDVSAKVHALDNADSVDVLSAPRVTTLANEDAVIKMVTETYYPDEWDEPTLETVSSNGGNSIPVFQPSIPTFGDATEEGIVLNVRPLVEENFQITLVMTPVIQQFVGWTDYSYKMPLTSNGTTKYYPNELKKPIIEARTVETTVVSYDGETIVLGGVIRDRVSSVDDQYPILGDIPLVGRLFQSKGRGSDKTSLLIFMTSRLIKPDGSPIRENEERGLPSFRY